MGVSILRQLYVKHHFRPKSPFSNIFQKRLFLEKGQNQQSETLSALEEQEELRETTEKEAAGHNRRQNIGQKGCAEQKGVWSAQLR